MTPINKLVAFILLLLWYAPLEIAHANDNQLLSQAELNDLSTDLSKSIGSSLKFDYKVDRELIGGLKLQLGSIMVDTSIRNKLKKYEQAMLEN